MAGKRRRTANESRAVILETATSRLREHGIDGLNITGVAAEAGLSHATLIHHFGSSGGMRAALAEKMSLELVADLVKAVEQNVSPAELASNVFAALTEGGHAKLLAWRAVEGGHGDRDLSAVTALFDQLLSSTQKVLEVDTQQELQRIILLVGTAAIGFGVAGDMLSEVLGMNKDTVEGFPAWITAQIG